MAADHSTKSLHPNAANLVGRRFGRLVVIAFSGERDKRGAVIWDCLCDCGNSHRAITQDLKRHSIYSCGCLARELSSDRLRKHGLGDTDEYNIWERMISRCHNPDDSNYHHYGARGIAVCQRWRESVEAFIADMGKRPSRRYSIDRIDNNRGYEPGNCRWATDQQQARNNRKNRLLTYQGETLCISEWTERLGFKPYTIQNRLHYGWTVEETLSTPEASPGKQARRKRD